MKLSKCLLILSLVAVGACSKSNTISLPSLTAPSVGVPSGVPSGFNNSIGLMSIVDNAWSGTTTATGLGSNGTLEADFTFDGENVIATLQWTSADTSLTYTGTVSGTVGNMIITTEAGQCSYTAQGALSENDTVFSGTYTASGPGVCPQKNGTFRLTREVECEDCDEVCIGPWSYGGDNPFQLDNSSDATELAYVLANVTPNQLSGPTKLEPGGDSWVADASYPVVMVKAGRGYLLYTNVESGDVLVGPADKDISHVSLFVCSEGE